MGGGETVRSAVAGGLSPPGINTWCAISVAAIEHNLGQLRSRLPAGCRLAVVVKSNAYGHGMVGCARRFLSAGADWLVVNAVFEAQELRRHGIAAPVYVCGSVAPDQADMVASSGARVVLYDPETARALNTAARQRGRVVPVHIKLETGMQRQGLDLGDALALARVVENLPGLRLEGLTSHFADMDEVGEGTAAQAQVGRFESAVQAFCEAGHTVEVIHIASSGAVLRLPRVPGTLARCGIAAYGLWPSAQVSESAGSEITLRPVLSWHCRVAQVKDAAAGASVGYAGTYTVSEPTRMAVLPVGYGEGLPRNLSGCGEVLIDGQRRPIRGRVCMNMTIVEVGLDARAEAGAVATLIGRQGESGEMGADEVARRAGTINYEITTRIHPDVPRFLEWPDGRMAPMVVGPAGKEQADL